MQTRPKLSHPDRKNREDDMHVHSLKEQKKWKYTVLQVTETAISVKFKNLLLNLACTSHDWAVLQFFKLQFRQTSRFN